MVGAVQEYGRVVISEVNNGLEMMNGFESRATTKQQPRSEEEEKESKWYEEEIDDDLKLCYALNSVLHRGASKYQEIALIDTKHFGKALIIDGKMQSAEVDEFIYHESLIHPPLLFHPNPKTVFIMGGDEGSAAREVLRHNTVQRVVMCDIDQVRIISMHAALALLHPWRNGNHAVLAARVRVSPTWMDRRSRRWWSFAGRT